MQQKYKTNTTVYNWYFDIYTNELTCDELTVYRYEYLDSMLLDIIDEYTLRLEYVKTYLKFFKKKKYRYLTLPGHLISDNKIYAKILLLNEMIRCFGIYLEEEKSITVSDTTFNAVKIASRELKLLASEYPELIIKAINAKITKVGSGPLWR